MPDLGVDIQVTETRSATPGKKLAGPSRDDQAFQVRALVRHAHLATI